MFSIIKLEITINIETRAGAYRCPLFPFHNTKMLKLLMKTLDYFHFHFKMAAAYFKTVIAVDFG